MYKIGIQFNFEAAHILRGLPEGHKCGRVHGHNYVVQVELASDTLDAVGFITDYFDLKPIKAWLDAEWDHRLLNDVVDFNPTVENMARHIYERFKPAFPQLSAVEIRETPTTFARWEPA